jgi:hypothetical protein
MDSVYFVMAILGCADDGMACRQERVEPVRYQSAAACQAAVTTALNRNTDLAYPVIGASCERRDRQFAEAKSSPRS